MDPFYTALLPLVGVAIGAAVPLIGILVQARYQARIARLKVIADLALADHQRHYDFVTKNGGKLPPLTVYLALYAAYGRILDHREVRPEDLAKLHEQQEKLDAVLMRQYEKQVKEHAE